MTSRSSSDSFTTIGKGIYLSRGQSIKTNTNASDTAPNVILMFGWMDAKLPHLHKYTEIYRNLYPEAAQILVQCDSSFFWRSQNANETRLLPVVEALEALGCIIPRHTPTIDGQNEALRPRILAHAFSNGGSSQLVTLGSLLYRVSLSTSQHAICAFVFDSCPGGTSLSTMKLAFTSRIRNPIVRYIAGLLISGIYLWDVIRAFFGKQRLTEVLKLSLKNPRVLPWSDVRTPRLYIYSKTDELIQWQYVDDHVNDLRRLGMDVQSDIFEDSPHVAHARTDPSRYWSAVAQLWKRAMTLMDGVP